jgi:hypothetical protein
VNWAWYALGAAVVIPLGIANARYRHLRWVRRHSYVATVHVYAEEDQ